MSDSSCSSCSLSENQATVLASLNQALGQEQRASKAVEEETAKASNVAQAVDGHKPDPTKKIDLMV